MQSLERKEAKEKKSLRKAPKVVVAEELMRQWEDKGQKFDEEKVPQALITHATDVEGMTIS